MICPACDSSSNIAIESTVDYKMYKCSECNLEFADPMKSGDNLFYQSNKFYTLKRLLSEKNITPSLRTKWEFGRFFKHNLNCHGKLLDIGCGEGQFLYYAKKDGYDVYGVEMDKWSVETAKKYYKLKNIYKGDFDSYYANKFKIKFDVITFFELIEHLESPKDFLKKVSDLLISGGYIALSTPNANRITVRLHMREHFDYPPHHLTRWEPATLYRFIESQGFKIMSHDLSPQILRSFITGRKTWWGGKNANADRFLNALTMEKKYALWLIKSYLRFLDYLYFIEDIVISPLQLFQIYGVVQFVLAKKIEQ